MKKVFFILIALLFSGSVFFSCKQTADFKNLSSAVVPISSPISNASCIGVGATAVAIKGTMLAGQTYTICGNVVINPKDTLIIQPGAIVAFTGNWGLGVHGTLISLGTKEAPVYFTYPGITKTDQIGANPANDPAFVGKWTGIIGAADCNKIILKWTHIEFAGGKPSGDIAVISASPYPIYLHITFASVLPQTAPKIRTYPPFRVCPNQISACIITPSSTAVTAARQPVVVVQ